MPNPNLPNNPGYNLYVGARYVPIFDGEWVSTKSYEPLTIVQYLGDSYTSKTFVAAGIAPTDETYWAMTGQYNAQIEDLRGEIANNAADITQLQSDLNNTNALLNTLNEEVGANTASIGNINDSIETIREKNTEQDASIQNIEQKIPTPLENSMENKKIMIVGDSVSDETAGTNWVTLLKNKIGNIATVNNNSLAGRKLVPDGCSVIDGINTEYDILIIFMGLNDLGNFTTSTASWAQAIVTAINGYRAKFPNCQVYLVSPLKYKGGLWSKIDIVSLSEILYQVSVICGTNFINFTTGGYEPFSNYGETVFDLLTADSYHPNQLGYQSICDKIFKYISTGNTDIAPFITREVPETVMNSNLTVGENINIISKKMYIKENVLTLYCTYEFNAEIKPEIVKLFDINNEAWNTLNAFTVSGASYINPTPTIGLCCVLNNGIFASVPDSSETWAFATVSWQANIIPMLNAG